MKKYLWFLLFPTFALALDWQACLEYKFPSAPLNSWELQDNSDGKGVYISKWNLPDPKPTKAELEAVEAQAVAWKTDKVKTDKADFDKWSADELRALVKVLLEEINVLRQKAGLEARTADQLKTAIKSKL